MLSYVMFGLESCPGGVTDTHLFNTMVYGNKMLDDAKAQDEAIRPMENCIEDLRSLQ